MLLTARQKIDGQECKTAALFIGAGMPEQVDLG